MRLSSKHRGALGSLVGALSLASLASHVNAIDTYEYVVVGSGPGGGVLATNLAKAGHSVFLIEAGDESPGKQGFGSYGPELTWDFFVQHYEKTDPRYTGYSHLTWLTPDGKYFVGQSGAPEGSKLLGVYYPRGATLGGSTMINAMVAWLPSDSDWNYHYNVTGDSTWKAENMHKIFQKIEKNNYLPKGTANHGFNGFFQTTMNTAKSTTGNQVMVAYAQELNLTQPMSSLLTRDPNHISPNRDQEQSIYGLVNHQFANGSRFSSRHYIQEEARQKDSKLRVSLNSLATKLLFDTTNKCGGDAPRAVGVEYLEGKSVYKADFRHKAEDKGVKKTVYASREVIVSGGAFNSPQILMLSGIGPRKHLEEFNITVVKDLPGVGQHLMDNQEMPIVGNGSAGAGEAGYTMIKSKHPAYGERDMFLMGGPGFLFRGFWPSQNRIGSLPMELGKDVYGVSMVKGSSVNKGGWVKLRSADPQDPPIINFNHYSAGSEMDIGAMKDTIAWIRTIYKKIGIQTIEPPCNSGSDANGYCKEDEAWLHKQTFGHHPTSTCKIGRNDDPMAVLDSKFRVRGVDGLRVVDASSFARIPGTFPSAPTFMISQKASDDMLDEVKTGSALKQCIISL